MCRTAAHMGWLRLVGSLKLQVSLAEYRLFYRALLPKRPIILRSLLIVATPYVNASFLKCEYVMSHVWMRHGAHVNASCHTLECVVSHVYMHHVTHVNASCYKCHTFSSKQAPHQPESTTGFALQGLQVCMYIHHTHTHTHTTVLLTHSSDLLTHKSDLLKRDLNSTLRVSRNFALQVFHTQKRPLYTQKRPICTQKRHFNRDLFNTLRVSRNCSARAAGMHVYTSHLQKRPIYAQKRPMYTHKRPICAQERPLWRKFINTRSISRNFARQCLQACMYTQKRSMETQKRPICTQKRL